MKLPFTTSFAKEVQPQDAPSSKEPFGIAHDGQSVSVGVSSSEGKGSDDPPEPPDPLRFANIQMDIARSPGRSRAFEPSL